MRSELRELIGARFFVGNVIERLPARMQRSIHVGILKFIGQHAADRIGVLAAKCGGPVVFQFDERGLGPRLILWAIGGRCGTRQRQRDS